MDRRDFFTIAAGAAAGAGLGAVAARIPSASGAVAALGLVGDGKTDDGPALQAAGDAALANGSGTLVLPFVGQGRYLIKTPVTWEGRSGHKALNIVGDGFRTKILPATGDEVAMDFEKMEFLRLSGLTFVGHPGVATDALSTLRFYDVAHVELVASQFYGISSVLEGGSIVQSERSDLMVQRCMFRGCTTNSGVEAAIINNEDWRGMRLVSSSFIDYGEIGGTYHSKTPMASSAGFVRLGAPSLTDSALGPAEAVLDDVRVDEGCYRALFVHSAVRIPAIRIRGLMVNGNGADGATAVHVQYTDRFTMASSWIGYRKGPGGRAIFLRSVGDADIVDVRCEDNMSLLEADAECGSVRIARSTFKDVRSQANTTVV